ncbi:hypothetical protein P175DRAFT_0532225 [Aspergillus ochraceoroseus IBT 24754]|uniref:Uncharacterized protein n=2 Tax=Aspergillus ochraceoroseus TaxID=138278 RepID=A0A2T5LX54_9EURO|nr:uncharacterized protein P175DRAFT_0532225 [Aspergillus ochraceoroseus IBT 24754]KKK22572.1 hypothetical protein AOCH_004774 [Aspergillus ochraceoroseus]PTU20860.1 hypothetical protein P175DRAFT_0532225 [Aspergillus ochraceoroseus IBT 24754]
MAPRPELYPLKTPSHIIFPSELQDYIRATRNPEPTKRTDGKGPSVPPPLAYTEFLKALSPEFGSPTESDDGAFSNWSLGQQLPSPISPPPTSSTISFPSEMTTARNRTRPLPHSLMTNAPRASAEVGSLHRIRVSPTFLYASAVESPPVERRARYAESPITNERTIRIQYARTNPMRFKRVPSLDPPPKGKRRRVNQNKK